VCASDLGIGKKGLFKKMGKYTLFSHFYFPIFKKMGKYTQKMIQNNLAQCLGIIIHADEIICVFLFFLMGTAALYRVCSTGLR